MKPEVFQPLIPKMCKRQSNLDVSKHGIKTNENHQKPFNTFRKTIKTGENHPKPLKTFRKHAKSVKHPKRQKKKKKRRKKKELIALEDKYRQEYIRNKYAFSVKKAAKKQNNRTLKQEKQNNSDIP